MKCHTHISIYGRTNDSLKVCDFTVSMQYLSFKLIVFVEIGLRVKDVFLSDIMANEQCGNQVKLEFILWVRATEMSESLSQ